MPDPLGTRAPGGTTAPGPVSSGKVAARFPPWPPVHHRNQLIPGGRPPPNRRLSTAAAVGRHTCTIRSAPTLATSRAQGRGRGRAGRAEGVVGHTGKMGQVSSTPDTPQPQCTAIWTLTTFSNNTTYIQCPHIQTLSSIVSRYPGTSALPRTHPIGPHMAHIHPVYSTQTPIFSQSTPHSTPYRTSALLASYTHST